MSGYYLHSRKIFELYIKRPQVFAVCEVILYNIRYKSCVQNGITVDSGQCLMTLQSISDICALSVSQVRTAIKTIADDKGITIENMGRRGMLITLLPAFSCEAEKIKARENKGSRTEYTKSTYKEIPLNTPDPNASYDLIRAEQRARSHPPKLKKRNR